MLTGIGKKLTFKYITSPELTSNYQRFFEKTTHTNSHQQTIPRTSNQMIWATNALPSMDQSSVYHGGHCHKVSRFLISFPPLVCVVSLIECGIWHKICNLNCYWVSCDFADGGKDSEQGTHKCEMNSGEGNGKPLLDSNSCLENPLQDLQES